MLSDQLGHDSSPREHPPEPPLPPPLRSPMHLGLQCALMAMSVWVLGSFLLGASYRVVGTGGIVVLLVTLVAVRLAVPLLDEDD